MPVHNDGPIRPLAVARLIATAVFAIEPSFHFVNLPGLDLGRFQTLRRRRLIAQHAKAINTGVAD